MVCTYIMSFYFNFGLNTEWSKEFIYNNTSFFNIIIFVLTFFITKEPYL